MAITSFPQVAVLVLGASAAFSLVDGFGVPLFSINTASQKSLNVEQRTDTKRLSIQEIRAIQDEKERQARASHNEKAWNALFVSVPERSTPTPCKPPVTPMPEDFPPGCLLRIGPNGGPTTDGFLDGDGMVQCITFPPNNDGMPHYFSSTYVETNGRQLEALQENNKRFIGSLGGAPAGFPLLSALVQNAVTFQTIEAQKDTCNTALAEHGGRVLALMEQCPPSELSVAKDGTVRTIESKCRLDGAVPQNDPITGGSFGAHGRTCPDTGDRVHVSYCSSVKPHGRVDVFTNAWNLKHSIDVDDMDCPTMIHDSAITKNYAIILDFPLTIRPRRMLTNNFPVEYEPEHGARIGLVPRHAGKSSQKTLWFDVEPGVVLHAANAYETDDGKVVVHAFRSEPNQEASYLSVYTTAFLYEWVLDTETGKVVSEHCLNADTLVDFPVIDSRHNAKEMDYVYGLSVVSIGGPLRLYKAPLEGVLFDGYVKLAVKDNAELGIKKGDVVDRYTLKDNWYPVTEATIVAKRDNKKGVDKKQGSYLVFIESQVPDEVPSWEQISQHNVLKSRVSVLDTESMSSGPVWSMDLPYHVPYGLHSCFLEWDKMK